MTAMEIKPPPLGGLKAIRLPCLMSTETSVSGAEIIILTMVRCLQKKELECARAIQGNDWLAAAIRVEEGIMDSVFAPRWIFLFRPAAEL